MRPRLAHTDVSDPAHHRHRHATDVQLVDRLTVVIDQAAQ
jgi:hypothetical protein